MNKSVRTFKIAICGDKAVGKTSLCYRFTDQELEIDYVNTIGVDLMVKHLVDEKIKLNFWDFAGDKLYSNITHSYIKGADIIVFVYNVESYDSIGRIHELHNLYTSINQTARCIVVGTRKDNILVSHEESGQQFSRQRNLPHFIVNCKTKKGIEDVFDKILNIIIEISPKNYCPLM